MTTPIDPNSNLAKQLQLSGELVALIDKRCSPESYEERVSRMKAIVAKASLLASLVDALDAHIAMGGALPRRWME
jgi:hypothetical protein